jgi:hypothetical protein
MLTDFVDSTDVRMIQRRGGAGLAPKSLQRLGIVGQSHREET